MGLSLRGTTSGAVDINAPAVAGDNTITLPNGNGSANQFFKNSDTAGIITHSSMTESSSGVISIGDIDIDGTTRTITTGVGQTVGFSTDIEVQGSVSISNGNLVLASGSGIDFSANANSAGMTSELLDDYEEGSWTPACVNIGTGTYQTRLGRYVKVGNICTIHCQLRLSALGTASGHFKITGLPFSVYNQSSLYSSTGSIHYSVTASTINNANALGVPNTSTIDFYDGDSTAITATSHAQVGTGAVIFAMTYISN